MKAKMIERDSGRKKLEGRLEKKSIVLKSLTDIIDVVGPGGDCAHGLFKNRVFWQVDQSHMVIELSVSPQLD